MLSLARFIDAPPLLKREKIGDLFRDLRKLRGVVPLFESKLSREYKSFDNSFEVEVTKFSERYVCFAGDLISRELWLHGEFDFHKLSRAHHFLRTSGLVCDLLVDVGANLGSIAIPAVKRGLFENAIAIEGNAQIHALLRKNIRLNDLDSRITDHHCVVSREVGLTYEISAHDSNLGAGRAATYSGNGNPVSSVTLDFLLGDLRPSLIFMDIEGFEGPALEGASTLRGSKTPIALEFNPNLLEGHIGKDEFISFFSEYSFVASLNDPLRIRYKLSKLGKFWDDYKSNSAVTDLIFF